MVDIELSQFNTFTVMSDTSVTVPFMPCESHTSQSPLRSMLLAESCTEATRPIIVSLNTNISTAAEAPMAVTIAVGSRPSIMLSPIITPMQIIIRRTIWNMPFTA